MIQVRRCNSWTFRVKSPARRAVERRVRRQLAGAGYWLKKVPWGYQVCKVVDYHHDLADLARELGVIFEGQEIVDD